MSDKASRNASDGVLSDWSNLQRPSIAYANLIALFSVVGLWIASAITLVIVPKAGQKQDIVMNALYYLPFMVVPVALYLLRHRESVESLRFGPVPLLPQLTVISLAVMSVFAATALDALWVRMLEAIGLHNNAPGFNFDSPRALMIAIINAAAVPAVCEELMFRGFMLAAWERRGTRAAVLMSTVMFALLHGNLYGLPAYLLVGAISAYLVFALRSLYAGIIYHTVYNASILAIVYAAQGIEGSSEPSGSILPFVIELAIILLFMLVMLRTIDARRRLVGIHAVPRARTPLRPVERWTLIATLGTMLITLLVSTAYGGSA